MDDYANVYGETFSSAKTSMELISNAIKLHKNIGFGSEEEVSVWAKENLLDLLVLSKSNKSIYHLTHYGEPIVDKTWFRYYTEDVLFIWEENEKGQTVARKWIPSGIDYYDAAGLYAEKGDGIRRPLIHRDYFTPTGYFDPTTQTFNVAKPFPVAACQTGRDTSHIYTLINHIAGECALWVLAWLRAKMIKPKVKTQVVPVFISRTQGTGKTTFVDVICRGVFGDDNVRVSNQIDLSARFNSDSVDSLILSLEEKDEDDKRNPVASLKSRSTGREVRKELKGVDPIYQDDYTEFVITTNKDIPLKFDTSNKQRRFIVMEADRHFVAGNPLADAVFEKLYGVNMAGVVTGTPFVEDKQLIAQFKHELYSRADIAEVNLKQIPQTAAAKRCFSMPRTNEAVDVEAVIRSLAPFIKASLEQGIIVQEIEQQGETLRLVDNIQSVNFIYYAPTFGKDPAMVCLNRPAVFYDTQNGKPFAHAVVERGLLDCGNWLEDEYGLVILPNTMPLFGGFPNVTGKLRQAACARFVLASSIEQQKYADVQSTVMSLPQREGARLRVNSKWRPDPSGEFETVNEMKPGVTDLKDKSNNVLYMDNFLLESDNVTKTQYTLEQTRLKQIARDTNIKAQVLFRERLSIQLSEAKRLLNEGIAWRIVYSGSKSYHVLVQIQDAPVTLDEYKWLHAHLATTLSSILVYDPVNSDPARLTRAPITFDRRSEYNGHIILGTQELVEERPGQKYSLNWRPLYEQWVNRPLTPYEQSKGRKMVPTKPEYKDAMQALLDGTFWINRIWNGRRQQCFFPAYRLCRLLGYTHEELWADGGILDNIEHYYRPAEIQYWKSRESSDIINQIDKDIDNA